MKLERTRITLETTGEMSETLLILLKLIKSLVINLMEKAKVKKLEAISFQAREHIVKAKPPSQATLQKNLERTYLSKAIMKEQ